MPKLGDIYRHLQKVPRHRDRHSAGLARTLGIPIDVAGGVLKQTAAELNNLAAKDLETDAHPNIEANDIRPIIRNGTKELTKHSPVSSPKEETVLERRVKQLSKRDRTILNYREQGKSYRTIAQLLGMQRKSAADALARIYAFLKDGGSRNGGIPDNEDGGESQPTESSKSEPRSVRAA